MPKTYIPITTTTLTTSQSTVSLTSIPATFTDIVLVVSARNTSASTVTQVLVQVNTDTGSNYSYTDLRGSGSAASSSRGSSQTSILTGTIAAQNGSPTPIIIQFNNYANTTTNKNLIYRSNESASSVRTGVGLWRSTSAISSIELKLNSDSYETGSIFTLYGIAAA